MLRVTTVWTAPQGGPYYSNFHFAGFGASNAADAHAAVAALWEALKAQISTAYSWTTQPDVVEINPSNGQIVDQHVVTAVNGVGTSAGQPLPFTTQGLLRWTTGFFQNGRQVRGRTFIPGMTENATQGGKPDAAIVTTISGLLPGFLDDLVPGNEFSIWSPTAGTVTHVNAGTFWSQWAVLRSRRD